MSPTLLQPEQQRRPTGVFQPLPPAFESPASQYRFAPSDPVSQLQAGIGNAAMARSMVAKDNDSAIAEPDLAAQSSIGNSAVARKMADRIPNSPQPEALEQPNRNTATARLDDGSQPKSTAIGQRGSSEQATSPDVGLAAPSEEETKPGSKLITALRRMSKAAVSFSHGRRQSRSKSSPAGTNTETTASEPSPSVGTSGSVEPSPEISSASESPTSELPKTSPAEIQSKSSEQTFEVFTRLTATQIAERLPTMGQQVSFQFDAERAALTENAPALNVSIPAGTSSAGAGPAPAAAMPSAETIGLEPVEDAPALTKDETAVPPQPSGDSVSTDAGATPQFRAVGAANSGRMAPVAANAQATAGAAQQSVVSEIALNTSADRVVPKGVDREERIAMPESSLTMPTDATAEMLEYLQADVPGNVRAIADTDFAPLLESSLAGPRQQVQQAAYDRDAERQRAFDEAQAEADTASAEADAEQQQAITDGHAQIAIEKQKGLAESEQKLSEFDAEVQSRHESNRQEIDKTIGDKQAKADAAIIDGEEKARAEEVTARESEARERREAEDRKPEKKKNRWGKLTDWFKRAINKWKNALVSAVKKVFEVAKVAVTTVLNKAKELAVGIIRGLRNVVVGMINAFAASLKVLISGLLIFFPTLRDRVNAAIDGVVETAIGIVDKVAKALEDKAVALIDRHQSVVNRVIDSFETAVVTALELAEALLTGNFLAAARILFLAACKSVGIPGEEFLDILADANDALLDIMKRPAKFLGYLLKSVGQGLQSFFSNFPQRMIGGLTGWLFGQVAEGGMTLPKSFDLKNLFTLLIQVMGITYDYIRGKVVSLVGEKAISVVEQVMTPIRILFTEGPGALWHWLADQADQAKKAIVEAASQWLITQIVTQAAIKLATMFTPVGAFVQAVLMMYNTIMFFVEKIKEIFGWVKSITASLKTIAVGAISAAADYIDQAMSKSIPLIVTFLAKLMGIDGVAGKIRQVVTKLRTPVDKAITFVVENLIKLAKAAWGGIKKGATAVKDTAVSWWKAATHFLLPGGEEHTLFYQETPTEPKLMLASNDEQEFDKRFAETKKRPELKNDVSKVGPERTALTEAERQGKGVTAQQQKLAKAIESTSPSFLEVLLPHHTGYSTRSLKTDPNDPFASDEAELTRDAVIQGAAIRQGGMIAYGGAMSALMTAGIVGPAVAAPGLVAPAIELAGNTLSLASRALRAAKLGGNLLYLQHPVLVVEGTSIAVGTIISVEGNFSEIPEAVFTDPANAIFIVEMIIVSRAGGKMPVRATTSVSRKAPKVTSFAVEKVDAPQPTTHRYTEEDFHGDGGLAQLWDKRIAGAKSPEEKRKLEAWKSQSQKAAESPDNAHTISAKQAEYEAGMVYSEIGVPDDQVIFVEGSPRNRTARGATIPDRSTSELQIEVKRPIGIIRQRSGTINDRVFKNMIEGNTRVRSLKVQVEERKKIPGQQTIILDIRGEKATRELAEELAKRTADAVGLPSSQVQVLY